MTPKEEEQEAGQIFKLNERVLIGSNGAELQYSELDYDAENLTEAQQLATDAVMAALNDNPELDVAIATDEEVEEMMEGRGDAELMATAERARAIAESKAIPITRNTKSRQELETDYQKIEPAQKDGRKIEFYHSMFNKVYREGGLFAQLVPQLKQVFDASIWAYSEEDNQSGTTREDGTTHKMHKNIVAYHNYVSKANINGKDYYVRFTIQEEKAGKQGTHSLFATEVSLYEIPSANGSLTGNPRVVPSTDGIVDAKLQQFFETSKLLDEKSSENVEMSIVDDKKTIDRLEKGEKVKCIVAWLS